MKKLLIPVLIAFCCLFNPSAYAEGAAEATPFIPPLKQKMKIPVIVLDPGHGGNDYGAASKNGVFEKDVVLDIAHRTRKILLKMGFEVEMTRTKDEFIKLSDRVKFSEVHNGDLFLSIHANAAGNKKATGFETFFLSPNKNVQGIEKYGGLFTYLRLDSKGKKSYKLAKIIQSYLEDTTGSENRGIKMAKFHVLRRSTIPAVLVETGFLSNQQEADLLNSTEYRNKIALALADSVKRFCRW